MDATEALRTLVRDVSQVALEAELDGMPGINPVYPVVEGLAGQGLERTPDPRVSRFGMPGSRLRDPAGEWVSAPF